MTSAWMEFSGTPAPPLFMASSELDMACHQLIAIKMNANGSAEFYPTAGGVRDPPQPSTCLWSRKLKALWVAFSRLAGCLSMKPRVLGGRAGVCVRNFTMRHLNLFCKYSVPGQPQEFHWQRVRSLLLQRWKCPLHGTHRWFASETFHFLLRNLKRPRKIRFIIQGEKTSRFLISESHDLKQKWLSKGKIYFWIKIIAFHLVIEVILPRIEVKIT